MYLNDKQLAAVVRALAFTRTEHPAWSQDAGVEEAHELCCQEQKDRDEARQRRDAVDAAQADKDATPVEARRDVLFEMHLNCDTTFTAAFGAKIKALGGKYSDVRGYASVRFVEIPNSPEGRALAVEVLARFGKTGPKGCLVLARLGMVSSQRRLHTWTEANLLQNAQAVVAQEKARRPQFPRGL